MEIVDKVLTDAFVLKPKVFKDNRGYFYESFNDKVFESLIGVKVGFIQDNQSYSSKGTFRGLHFQTGAAAQAKLVRVIDGNVLDIALDVRKYSPTFGQHVVVELTGENKHQLFIPHGFAHGFVVLSKSAIFSYKVDNYYAPEFDRGIAFDDKNLSINWQLPLDILKLSDKDKNHPTLANARDLFD